MRAIYPGTFDPVHYGHQDIYTQAAATFDEVIPVIAVNGVKDGASFLGWEREEMWKRIIGEDKTVHHASMSEPIFVTARNLGVSHIVRGLRNSTDFDAERAYREFIVGEAPELQIAYFMCDEELLHVSSSAVRQILKLEGGHDMLANYLPPTIRDYLSRRFV